MNWWPALLRRLAGSRRVLNILLCALVPISAFLHWIALLLEIDFPTDAKTERRWRIVRLFIKLGAWLSFLICLSFEVLNHLGVIHLEFSTSYLIKALAVMIVLLKSAGLEVTGSEFISIINEILAEFDKDDDDITPTGVA